MNDAQPPATVGSRLATTATRFAERIAIVEGETELTYAMLDAAATRIAARLVALATTAGGPGDSSVAKRNTSARVCLLFERKALALQALAGAARAAVAYVLLDAGDPLARLRLIVADSEPIAIVTEPALLDRARDIAPGGCPIVNIEGIEPSTAPAPLPDVAPDALLFLCYTSGSTGQPKGVSQTHGNRLLAVDAYTKSLRIDERDRLSLVYTLSFNAADLDIHAALLTGATLCAYDARRDGVPQLADWLDRHRVTVLHAVPTLFREIAKRLPAARVLPHLRAVVLGGEAVFPSDVALFRAHTRPDCVLVNQLAATEVGVIAQHVVDHTSPLSSDAIVPVGACPDDVAITIRRDDGSNANAGEAGEMVVRSRYLSPGYWRRPELDAVTFGHDPMIRGWREYRSGDVGRIDTMGNLHFLGRKGSRVKIRGHSVELPEIEGALSSYPGLARAAVIATSEAPQAPDARLVAYVAMDEGQPRDGALLRRHLAARLPSYMAPHDIVFVDALPLTSSGKVDRATLPPLASDNASRERPIEAPRDDIEREIVHIAEGLLGFSPIGRDDDFFLLGGDSLMAVELQSRLLNAFGVHVGNFHEDATIARIARNVRDARSDARGRAHLPVMIPLWREGSAVPLFLVHGRHGQAFVSPHFMRLLGNDQPVWAFQARGLDAVQSPYASVEEMAADYVMHVREQRTHGPYFIGALCAGAFVAAEMARALRDMGETVLPLLLLDPPDGLLGGYSQIGEARFVDKMKTRRAMGGTIGPSHDPAYMQSVMQVARAFERALARHDPRPYDGSVFMLSSRQRMGSNALLARVFTGATERFEIGGTHAEALDPRNPHFASCLLRCVDRVREAARKGGVATSRRAIGTSRAVQEPGGDARDRCRSADGHRSEF
ncbi:MAG TPA: AMP-binding protein [Casimicrobiaceae bacterium]|nr:AMP-binding protein [Casimicrobiaceae bacterium]